MVTKAADQVVDTVAILDKLETAIRSLTNRQNELQREINDIERLGWVDATPYYREHKFLILIHPMKDGQRKREYIGANPEKIQEALDRIDRKSRFEELHNQLSEVQRSLSNVRYHLTQAMGEAYRVKW